MTRIESRVTIPKGLFTLYILECQESDGQNFLAAIVRCDLTDLSAELQE
jgi:hypothetical protein